MKPRIWLPMTLLVLASLGCSLLGRAGEVVELGKEAATRVSGVATAVGEEGIETLMPEIPELPGEETEDEPLEEAPAAEEVDEGEIDVESLEGLDSYRTRLTSEWMPTNGDPERISFEEARTRDPAAQRLVMENFPGEESLEIVQIGNQSWMCSGGSCTQMEADPDELASGFSEDVLFDPDDVVDDASAEFVGRETVNGVQTRHYVLDLPVGEVVPFSEGEVSDPTGEAWVADEAGLPRLVVRFEMGWAEERESIGGQVSFTYETYDINEPFTIEPPAEAAEGGLPDDVPVYPNASGMISMEGMASFDMQDGVMDVADFYREALAAEGWTAESDDELGDMVQQTWSKGARSLMLIISEEDEGSNVVITVDDGS